MGRGDPEDLVGSSDLAGMASRRRIACGFGQPVEESGSDLRKRVDLMGGTQCRRERERERERER